MNPDERERQNERLEILEMKVSFQDRTIEALNEIVTRQQDQIDKLTVEVEKLSDAMTAVTEDGVDAGQEPAPPHY